MNRNFRLWIDTLPDGLWSCLLSKSQGGSLTLPSCTDYKQTAFSLAYSRTPLKLSSRFSIKSWNDIIRIISNIAARRTSTAEQMILPTPQVAVTQSVPLSSANVIRRYDWFTLFCSLSLKNTCSRSSTLNDSAARKRDLILSVSFRFANSSSWAVCRASWTAIGFLLGTTGLQKIFCHFKSRYGFGSQYVIWNIGGTNYSKRIGRGWTSTFRTYKYGFYSSLST